MNLTEAIETLSWAGDVWLRIAQQVGLDALKVREVVECWEKERENREKYTITIMPGYIPQPLYIPPVEPRPYEITYEASLRDDTCETTGAPCVHEFRRHSVTGGFVCSKCGVLTPPTDTSPRSPAMQVWVDD